MNLSAFREDGVLPGSNQECSVHQNVFEKSCLEVFVVKMKLEMRVKLVLGGRWEGHYRSKYSKTS